VIGERRAGYAGYRTRELFVEGAGPKLVLVHGFGHPAPCWRPVLERCARAHRPAVAIDLPGFGLADPLAPGPALPQLVRFLEAVVTAQGASAPVVLVGNSLGAATAVRMLDTVPGLPVRGLVALDIATDQWTPLVKTLLVADGRAFTAAAGLPLPRLLQGSASRRLVARLLYGDPRAADPAMVRMLADQFSTRTGRRELARLATRLKAEVSAAARTGDIACPTIVVHGRRDLVVAPAASRNLHAATPGSRLVLLDGIGHCPHLDAPDDIVALATELAGPMHTAHAGTA